MSRCPTFFFDVVEEEKYAGRKQRPAIFFPRSARATAGVSVLEPNFEKKRIADSPMVQEWNSGNETQERETRKR